MIHDGEVKGLPLIAYNGAKAAIEALSAIEGMLAYATDTDEFGFRKTSAWEWISAGTGVVSVLPDNLHVGGYLNVGGDINVDGMVNIGSGIFRLAETALDLDFTGVYDTKAECEALGLKFGDSNSYPFPDQLVPGYATNKAWSHSAGTGWTATLVGGEASGGFIIVPIMRPGNWEIEIVVDYTPDNDNANQIGFIHLGYISNSNHMGAEAALLDVSTLTSTVNTYLYTNDGDDTITSRYSGAAQSAGDITLALRSVNGVLQIYDDQDNAWHDYEGHQTTTVSYTAGWTFFGISNVSTAPAPWTGVHIKSFKLTYLL